MGEQCEVMREVAQVAAKARAASRRPSGPERRTSLTPRLDSIAECRTRHAACIQGDCGRHDPELRDPRGRGCRALQRGDGQADHAHMQTGCASSWRPARTSTVAASDTVAAPQGGFVGGKRIEEFIVGFDWARTTASLRSGMDAFGILFDLAHAFPSLVRIWMFMVLARVEVW